MRNNKGFTLIELMIVVIILGVLAAILIPRFMGAQNDARINAATADISLIREGLGLCFVYDGIFPAATDFATLRAAIGRHISPPTEGRTFEALAYSQTDLGRNYAIDAEVVNVTDWFIYADADTIWDKYVAAP